MGVAETRRLIAYERTVVDDGYDFFIEGAPGSYGLKRLRGHGTPPVEVGWYTPSDSLGTRFLKAAQQRRRDEKESAMHMSKKAEPKKKSRKGICARRGCTNRVPERAVEEGDVFCSIDCARRYHETVYVQDGKQRGGPRVPSAASKRSMDNIVRNRGRRSAE